MSSQYGADEVSRGPSCMPSSFIVGAISAAATLVSITAVALWRVTSRT